MIGTTVRGRYRLDAVVGTGAFATVYRAHDERLEADVAVKVLAENHSLDPEMRERFINEARRLRQVDSPAVVAVHDLGETERSQPFIVMELADRGDLARRVAAHREAGGAVVPDDLLAVASTVAGALTALHARRVVHRDVTPRNLLLRSVPGSPPLRVPGPGRLIGSDERLVVGDLGLSKDLALASGITAAVGTPGFSPPEQRIGSGVEERTDVYAASALLVWLVTGRPPDDEGRWPGAAFGGWPAAVAVALERGLSRTPAERHATAAEWHAELRAALAPTELPTTVPVAPAAAADPNHAPARPRPRSRRVPPWAVAAMAVVMVIVVVVGAVAGAFAIADRDDGASGTRTRDVGSGQIEAEASEGELTVVIRGPEVLTVDEAATFTVEEGSAESWAWIGPDGRISPDAPSLEVVPESEGRLEVTLVATDEVGGTVRVVLPARAREP